MKKVTSENIKSYMKQILNISASLSVLYSELAELLPKIKEQEEALKWYPLRKLAKNYGMTSQEFKQFLKDKKILSEENNINEPHLKKNRFKQYEKDFTDYKNNTIFFISNLGRTFLELNYPELRERVMEIR